MVIYLLVFQEHSDFAIIGGYDSIKELKRDAYQMIAVESLYADLDVKRIDTVSHNVRSIGYVSMADFQKTITVELDPILLRSHALDTTGPVARERFKVILKSREEIEAWMNEDTIKKGWGE